jgi:hypothetical protein
MIEAWNKIDLLPREQRETVVASAHAPRRCCCGFSADGGECRAVTCRRE